MAVVRKLIVTSDIKISGNSMDDPELVRIKNPDITIEKGTEIKVSEKLKFFSISWKNKNDEKLKKPNRVNISKVFKKHLDEKTTKPPHKY